MDCSVLTTDELFSECVYHKLIDRILINILDIPLCSISSVKSIDSPLKLQIPSKRAVGHCSAAVCWPLMWLLLLLDSQASGTKAAAAAAMANNV